MKNLLKEQKFEIDDKVVKLIRHDEKFGVIMVNHGDEKIQVISLNVKVIRQLIHILSTSPFIFSDQNK